MPTIGDDNIDWDADASRASKAKWPYVDEVPLQYLQSVVSESPTLLDLGCQIGSWHHAWKTFRPKMIYVGLDFSEYALSIAKERYPESYFVCKKAAEMNYIKVFDIIFTHAVLQHNNTENAMDIIFNCHKALKEGGLLIIQENIQNKFSPEYWREIVGNAVLYGFEEILYKDFGDGGAGFVFKK